MGHVSVWGIDHGDSISKRFSAKGLGTKIYNKTPRGRKANARHAEQMAAWRASAPRSPGEPPSMLEDPFVPREALAQRKAWQRAKDRAPLPDPIIPNPLTPKQYAEKVAQGPWTKTGPVPRPKRTFDPDAPPAPWLGSR